MGYFELCYNAFQVPICDQEMHFVKYVQHISAKLFVRAKLRYFDEFYVHDASTNLLNGFEL